MNRYDGSFVSIEGLDKSGKSSLVSNLQGEVDDSWEFTKEPSEGAFGQILREELQTDSDPTMSDFFLFCADRVDHIQSLIGPKLDSGENIITDRYNLSTYAYQSGVVRENIVSKSGVEYIDSIVSEWLIEPDLCIVVDVSVDESIERMGMSNEKYENIDKLTEAKEVYDRFAERKDNVVKVDGMQSEEAVLEEAMEYINEVGNSN